MSNLIKFISRPVKPLWSPTPTTNESWRMFAEQAVIEFPDCKQRDTRRDLKKLMSKLYDEICTSGEDYVVGPNGWTLVEEITLEDLKWMVLRK